MINTSDQMTPREALQHEWDIEQFKMQAEHATAIKQLELEALSEKNQAEIRLKELESKWSSWLKIPIIVLKLPVYILFSFGFIISVVTKKELSTNFWKFMK